MSDIFSNNLRFLETKNVKKMYSKNKDVLKNKEIFTFTPPRRHDGKESYISFSIIDSVSGKRKRKKYMLDRYKKGMERDVMAAQIISNIYTKLMHGWNPWVAAPSLRSDVPLNVVIVRYRLNLDQLHRKNVIKDKTYVDWKSRLSIFQEYLVETNRENFMAFQVNHTFAVDYLDYILLDRDVSARTRNNHRAWLSVFCNWMIEKNYIEENPTKEIPLLKEEEKFREPLTKAALHRLSAYLKKTDKHFLLAVMMEYFTLIRPTELSKIKLSDFNISEQSVFISSEISKNRKDGKVALNDKILKLMIDLEIFKSPSHYYLFGKEMMPSERPATAAIFRKKFAVVREELKFPKKYQFYSLKDSGIRDLANSNGIVNARDQARHADVSTTNKYLQGRDKSVDEGTKHFKGEI